MRRSGRNACCFILDELAGEAEALSALGAAPKTLIGFPFAADAIAGELPDLRFPQGVARANDHRGRTFIISGPRLGAAGPRLAIDMQ